MKWYDFFDMIGKMEMNDDVLNFDEPVKNTGTASGASFEQASSVKETVLNLFTTEALLVAIIVGIVISAIRMYGTYPGKSDNFWDQKWPYRVMIVLPILFGMGASVLPGIFNGSMAIKLLWGGICGGLSHLILQAVGDFLRSFKDFTFKWIEHRPGKK